MKFKFLTAAIIALGITGVQAQDYYGASINRAKNVHAGNKIRVTFHNNARLGTVKGDNSVTYTGEWPIGTGKVQMGNTSPYVMSELRFFKEINSVTGDSVFDYITPAIFCEGWDPAIFSHDSLGTFWGFEPVNGYLNVSQKEKDPFHAVAMSHQPFTWPAFWPDKQEDVLEPGWPNHWNGYFGKDQKNADEESFFVLDDYSYQKRLKGYRLPLPFPATPGRGGLGLSMAVRGLQWSNPDAEDVIFWLYDIQNMGVLKLDKTVFGINVGASSGGSLSGSGSDNNDDAARFYREKALAVNYDLDNVGVGGYRPVPWVGFAFLESPGNPFDGIDNDGDANNPEKSGGGTGKVISVDDFTKFYAVGDAVILVNYNNPVYPRTVSTMPAAGVKLSHNGVNLVLRPNAPLTEIPRNGLDDNLNGLIDENDGAKIYDPVLKDSVEFFLYIKSDYNKQDYLAIDYFTGAGSANLLIDERRDDKIDNDGDWDPAFDDVGLDGKPGTGDEGEGDGVATPGKGNLPGEPNIDKVDVDESDQIGLTNFKFYIYGTLTYSNDDQMWNFSRPGYFDNSTTGQADYDYIFSSGFFPLQPGSREFFSIAMVYGEDETDILRNKDVVQNIYNSNYNFAMAPTKPKLSAVAGDNKVTLYWDDGAEYSFDRFLKDHDFEGYKIYKSSHYTFGDAGSITDGLGYERFKKPLVIYDKIDSVFGFFPKDFGTGVLFNLGNESGLVHKWVDEDVINGVKYYYAVTAFDRGDIKRNIGPSETTIFLNVDPSGEIQFAENVLAVTPQAPSAGFESAGFDIVPKMVGEGRTYGSVGVNLLNPDSLVTGDVYELQFLDQSMDEIDNDFDGILDQADPDEKLPIKTTGFTLRNLTRDARQDTTRIDTVAIEVYGTVKSSAKTDSLVLIENLYDDNDRDPRTFSKVLQGMEIVVNNPLDSLYTNPEEGIVNGIKWSDNIPLADAYSLQYGPFKHGGLKEGMWYPRQYMVVFYNEVVQKSASIKVTATAGNQIPVPGVNVNYRVFDLNQIDSTTGKLKEVPFAVFDATKSVKPGQPRPTAGFYSAGDKIILFENTSSTTYSITTMIFNEAAEDSTFYKLHGDKFLGSGDTLKLYSVNPFTGNTKYTWTVRGEAVNKKTAGNELNQIRVVPNPYVVTALWEPSNPYSSGRGPRLVQFINLPQVCTIRIYSVDGTLVRKIDHHSTMANGAAPWDLMTKDNMDVAYGLYIYHIDAPGVGEHVGRFLLIK
ncbi:MAG: hypothetical protein L6Q77_07145 [Bacteroidetes bacterium]|nr:hypothetical protein [Bacteroidota bacterium]